MKIFVFAFCLVLGGYVIGEIVGHNDPSLQNPFASLQIQEFDRDLPSLDTASGDPPEPAFEPDFEEMAIEERHHGKIGTF